MNKPRPSIFRETMQVSPTRIAAMNDTELNELMVELFRAQAHRCRSSLAQIMVNTEGRAKDDGCDGWTVRPELPDDWLGDTDTCWQFKAGSAGTPANLKGEVLKPIPRGTLEAGSGFVVVTSGSTSGKKGENNRLNILCREANEAGVPTSKIAVIGSERLAEWCNHNPAVASHWSGRPGGLWTLRDWSDSSLHQAPWQESDGTRAKIDASRKGLDFETGSILHLHIYGQPGVGKTRFALELCREAPWSASVIYIPQATDHRVQELIDSAAYDPGVRLVVVVDEVQSEQLRTLRESIERGNGRLRLITIGHCPTPDTARIPALELPPMDNEMARMVVKGWYPAMPYEHVEFVIRFADGFIRLAQLAADAVARNTTIDVRGLLSCDDIRIFLDGMLGSGSRRALYVVAVFRSIGWIDDAQSEGVVAASHLGLDWNDVRASVEDYDRRLGIAPRGGRYRYISPTPLATYLAVEAWRTYPGELRSMPSVLPTEGAREAYYDRLRMMASNPQTREYARDELNLYIRIDDFVDARAVRRWSAYSAADPDTAARIVYSALKECSIEDRARNEGQARRELVCSLVRLAWRPRAFANAVKSLALLSEAENESWDNNATSEFIARYQVFLGGTAVPYCDRLDVLDELYLENNMPFKRLAIKALALVSNIHETRMAGEPPSDELPEAEWHPSTGAEHLRCIHAAFDRLTEYVKRADPLLIGDFINAAKESAMMLRRDSTRHLVGQFFEVVRDVYPDAREPLRRAISEVVIRERKYWKELAPEVLRELDSLHSRFEDSSLKARIRQHLGQPPWEHEEQYDLRPMAKELLETDGALAEEWPWLISGEAEDAWRFGEALAEVDTSRTLATIVAPLSVTGCDIRVLCSYIYALRKILGDEWYDEYVESLMGYWPNSIILLFEIARSCGITASIAERIEYVLRTNDVAPEVVGQLGFGRWGENLEPSVLDGVLRAMVDRGHYAPALAILEHRTKASAEDLERWRYIALMLIVNPALIRSRNMTNFYWQQLALRLVKIYTVDIATAIINVQCDRTNKMWFLAHSEAATVLDACVVSNPKAVWEALLPHIVSRGEALSVSIGFPRGIVDKIPLDMVLRWVEGKPEERAAIIARFTTMDLSSDETMAARILSAYGNIKNVDAEYFGEYISGAWSGPLSLHWEQLALALKVVAERTMQSKIREWAISSIGSLERMAERDRQMEEERDIRRDS